MGRAGGEGLRVWAASRLVRLVKWKQVAVDTLARGAGTCRGLQDLYYVHHERSV